MEKSKKSILKTFFMVIFGIILNTAIIIVTTYFCRSLKLEEKKAKEYISDNEVSVIDFSGIFIFESEKIIKNKVLKFKKYS